MSFILDALRKSDARRRMGQSPDLASAPPAPHSGARRSRLLALFGIMSLLVIGLAGAWLGRDLWLPGPDSATPVASTDLERQPGAQTADDDRGTGMADRSALPDEPREVVVTDPGQIEGEVTRRLARDRAVPGPPLTVEPVDPEQRPDLSDQARRLAVDPAEQARIERVLEEAERQRRREAAGLAPEPDAGLAEAGRDEPRRSAAGEPAPRWTPEVAEYVRQWELPLSVRRNMPDLKLSIHVYSPDPEARFVLVNGERFIIGDMLSDGARLVDIRREGAIVDFRDHRFLLEP